MFKNTIVAAANQVEVYKNDEYIDTLVIPDACHYGRNMQKVFEFLRNEGYTITHSDLCDDRGQGFIDESGMFWGRSSAYEIAKESGQPFNDQYTLPNNKLDSSCIRHFPEECDLKDYMEE